MFAGDTPVTINFTAPPVEAAANTIYVYSKDGKTFVVGDNDGKDGLDFGLELTGTLALKTSDFITTSGEWDAFFTKIASPTDYSAFHSEVLL